MEPKPQQPATRKRWPLGATIAVVVSLSVLVQLALMAAVGFGFLFMVREASNPVTAESALALKTANAVDSGDLGDYHAEILEAVLVDDYDGSPSIAIHLRWTNNSTEPIEADSALYSVAYQDGVELAITELLSDDPIDTAAQYRKVKPGVTQDVWMTYCLSNETSTVEFTLEPWSLFSVEALTKYFEPSKLAQN